MPKKTFIMNDQSVNSYGFILMTEGIDLSRFKKNPVMLFNHNEDVVPGKWEDVKVQGTQLLGDPVFDEDDTEAQKLSKKVEKDFIKGCSLGIIPEEFAFGGMGYEDVLICTKSTLIECSITPIPSNGNALKLYNKDGKLMNDQEIKLTLSATKPNQTIPTMKNRAILLGFLGLAADATDDAFQTALEKLVKERDQLKIDLKAEQDKATAANKLKVAELVDSAIASGKLTAAEREEYIKNGESNYDLTKKMLEKIQPHKSLTAQLNADGSKKDDTDPRKDWTFDDWSKKDSKGLMKLKAENKEKYQLLYDAFYKK